MLESAAEVEEEEELDEDDDEEGEGEGEEEEGAPRGGARVRGDRKIPRPSVWRVVCRTFGPFYAVGGVYKLIYDLISFVSPLILRLVVNSTMIIL